MGDRESNLYMNRSQSAGQFDIPVETMFKLATRTNDSFGVEGYEVPVKHVDAARQVQEREYLTQKQGLKDKKYVCKRGNFLDDYIQLTRGVPASCNYYKPISYVSQADLDKGKKLPKDTQKHTFIEQIFQDAQKGAVPGVGKYNIDKSQQQIEEETKNIQDQYQKLKYGMRLNFLCEYEYLGNSNPGPGQHNPHEIQNKLVENKTMPADFIKKHKEMSKQYLKSKDPDVGTYQPFPAAYQTFGRMMENQNRPQTAKVKYFGTEQRFKDPKKSKSKIDSINPAPNKYELIPSWPGQEDGLKKDSQQKNWMNSISKGTTFSIYYK